MSGGGVSAAVILAAPSGIAVDAAGHKLWLVYANTSTVSARVDGQSGSHDWSALDNSGYPLVNPQGIATDGGSLWIVDAGANRVDFYANAVTNPPPYGGIPATSSF